MTVIGIDLGTTNTVVTCNDQVVRHATDEGDSPLLPSVVAFPPSGAKLVGVPARRRRAIDPKNTVFSSKRIIGLPWTSAALRAFGERYPFELSQSADGGAAFVTRAGQISPVEVGAMIMRFALANVATSDATIAITVPAEFKREQREATLTAARQAGLGTVHLIDEPLSTAAAYLSGPHKLSGVKIAAVYDFGGGTFDFDIVECSGDSLRLLAQGGDLYLGGDDIDFALANWVAQGVLSRIHWDYKSDPIVFDRLVLECERAKMRLCTANETIIDLSQVDPAAPISSAQVPLTRQRLDSLCSGLVSRTFVICDEVLRKAGVVARQVDVVLLAGGTSLLPAVQDMVTHYFGSRPHCEIDPLQVVSLGAPRALPHLKA